MVLGGGGLYVALFVFMFMFNVCSLLLMFFVGMFVGGYLTKVFIPILFDILGDNVVWV